MVVALLEERLVGALLQQVALWEALPEEAPDLDQVGVVVASFLDLLLLRVAPKQPCDASAIVHLECHGGWRLVLATSSCNWRRPVRDPL